MEDSQLRQLKYLIESQGDWKPDQLVISPWEIGLTSKASVNKVVRRTTLFIQRVMEIEHDGNDTR
jgi:hypothetical protein